jgi:hypothetical protein
MGDKDEHDMEDMSGYEQSGVRHACLGLKDLVLVLAPARSGLMPAVAGLLPAVLGMVV